MIHEYYKYEITPPTNLCLYNKNHQNHTLDFFSKLESFCNEDTHQILIDFSKLEFLSAAAANYLFSLVIYNQLRLSNSLFTYKLPKDKKQKKLFTDSGFHRAIKAGGMNKIENLWKTSDFLCGNNDDRAKLLKLIKERCNIVPFPDKLSSAIKETFLNIHHHAYIDFKNPVPITWFCYFYINEDDSGRYLSIIVQDLGQGMVNSIKNAFPDYKIKADHDCIKHAMTKSVTSTHIQGRGQGSFDIKKPLIYNRIKGNDNLFIISAHGNYNFSISDDSEEFQHSNKLDSFIRGTLIEWTLYY